MDSCLAHANFGSLHTTIIKALLLFFESLRRFLEILFLDETERKEVINEG
jgi:hypothetical protein